MTLNNTFEHPKKNTQPLDVEHQKNDSVKPWIRSASLIHDHFFLRNLPFHMIMSILTILNANNQDIGTTPHSRQIVLDRNGAIWQK